MRRFLSLEGLQQLVLNIKKYTTSQIKDNFDSLYFATDKTGVEGSTLSEKLSNLNADASAIKSFTSATFTSAQDITGEDLARKALTDEDVGSIYHITSSMFVNISINEVINASVSDIIPSGAYLVVVKTKDNAFKLISLKAAVDASSLIDDENSEDSLFEEPTDEEIRIAYLDG